ncbi:MAG TPA: glycosyltransferase [Saprospiraceae bacterium]|nr:glycosyltransferase [Saprospiraceae bacterium]
MRLSIIIVNYNVRHFLEQALGSVRRAVRGIDAEVWVVDNNSVDDSVRMVEEKFPEVRLIVNRDNPGFAKANNQAIRQSTGEYVLLLNPDTLVEEDTFSKCLAFMDSHPEAGALGCKLIDGTGKFLPESKRGFPSPWVAFCKTFGLSAIFPRSKTFNRYYLGYLDVDKTSEADVLAGCFMFIRRSALDRAGLLDEAFFMYGEDIDLSYRIIQAGFKNYYFPETKIIHYKGESTKKGSLNYVRTFYQAMIIFTRKHFTGRQAGLFVFMLQGAIWLRAGMTLAKNFWDRIWLPAVDTMLIYAGLVVLKNFWANYYYKDPEWFKTDVLWFSFPLYILIWLGTAWLNGGYDQRYDIRRLVRGLAFGTVVLAAVYGFLDLDYRPSRALVLMGAVWAVLATIGVRAVAHFVEFKNFRLGLDKIRNLLIVGSMKESERVTGLLRQVGISPNLIGVIAPPGETDGREYLCAFSQMDEVVRIYRVNELIFCSKDIRSQDIMACMTRLGPAISYKIVPEESMSIIGSSSKDEPGELYTIAIRYNIAQAGQRRNKRVFDLLICLALIPAAPFWLLFSSHRMQWIGNWRAVFSGKKTWVGYAPQGNTTSLPSLKTGVFSPLDTLRDIHPTTQMIDRLNFLFAKDWNVWRDLTLVGQMLVD